MIYYIDLAHPGENAPGSLVGQNFNTYVYSWDNVFSAGTTVWNSIPFGTFLTRNALPPVPYSNNFNMHLLTKNKLSGNPFKTSVATKIRNKIFNNKTFLNKRSLISQDFDHLQNIINLKNENQNTYL